LIARSHRDLPQPAIDLVLTGILRRTMRDP
jgi:hypothetical protein